MTDWLPTIIVAFIAAVPGIAALLAARGKNRADAASTLTGAALQMVNELQEQIRAARDDAIQLTAQLATTRAELSRVTSAQLEQSVLISTMRDTIAQLQAENASLKERIKELVAENELFRTELERLGHKPDTGPSKRKR